MAVRFGPYEGKKARAEFIKRCNEIIINLKKKNNCKVNAMKQPVAKAVPQQLVFTGTMVDYSDLYFREEKRCRHLFVGQPHDYDYAILVSKDLRVTSAQIYYKGGMVGAGVAVRCDDDDYYESAGNRLAISRALASIGVAA